MKTGIIHQSRKQSDSFLSLSSLNRDQYLKHTIAILNVDQLVPFVKITDHDENFRKIHYTVHVPGSEEKSSILFESRRQGDFVRRLPAQQRDAHLIHFIASCNVDQLYPFIQIVRCDRYYRQIEYTIQTPQLQNG